MPCRNGGQRSGHLFDGAERIARSMDEQRRSSQPREMLGAKLFRFARRMQWIREQEKGIRDRGYLRSQ